jgi:guanine deaminase
MRTAFRGSVLHCLADPGEQDDESAVAWLEDGLLVVEDGLIAELGEADMLLGALSGDTRVEDFSGKLIVPGLIDCHVHYPQIDVIGSYGEELLDWLHRYAFPMEMRFADETYAREVAAVFVDEILKNGTTTALVFGTVHAHSADAIFEAAAAKNMRLIAGKVLMDSNCPEELRDSAATGYDDSKQLIERWHGKGRLGYAITPRFALTSSEAQLEAAGRLAAEYPDVWVHTHLAENHDEVEQISRLFPWSSSYLDVYDRFGLVRERSVFAHCLHLQDEECRLMAESPRQRPVRSAPAAPAAGSCRAGHRRWWWDQPVAPQDHARGIQGPAPPAAAVTACPRAVPGDTGGGGSPVPRGPDR